MSRYTIYHNPRCSKSRQALALLEEREVDVDVIKYLETPPTAATLQSLLDVLGMRAWDLIRRKEAVCKQLGLTADMAEEDLVAAMVAHPVLIERPIVVCGAAAVIGRPPENVLALIDR